MATETTGTKAILVVSFGTSYEETRKLNIEAIEQDITDAFPGYQIYRAWTSKMILAKIKARDHIHIDTVKEAMERMAADGMQEILVQPTHVTNGIENDLMKEDVLSFKDRFTSIRIGSPLLTTEEDKRAVIRAVADEWNSLSDDTALVFMGHGAAHYANSIYAAMDYTFKDLGYRNIFIGTVEAYPDLDAILRNIKASDFKKIALAPFMIVAGDHATNDLAGDEPDSWKSRFEAEGYPVQTVLKGLGEYPAVRRLFVSHLEAIAD
jgi:sirohydrochlorin cobaltochelatase